MVARDYIIMGIPASTCLAVRSFSMSATDDDRRRQTGAARFGAVQRLRAGYRDGRLKAIDQAWQAIEPDFDVDDSESIDK